LLVGADDEIIAAAGAGERGERGGEVGGVGGGAGVVVEGCAGGHCCCFVLYWWVGGLVHPVRMRDGIGGCCAGVGSLWSLGHGV
jgi:hypothetical protein